MTEKRIPIRAFLVDLVLNTAIPLACYRLARARGASELAALVISSVYPLASGLWTLLRSRTLNPFSLLVLIGLVVSGVALLLGGSPRVLLLRESLPTLGVGLTALVTLAAKRPLMYFFARHMVAGNDPEKLARFTARSSELAVMATHRRITAVWGTMLTLEFFAKAWMVWNLPTTQVLLFGPALFNAVMIGTMVWTVRYAKSRSRLSSSAQMEQA